MYNLSIKRERRKKRKKQKKINVRLKKRIFGHLAVSSCYYCHKIFIYDDLTVEHIVPLCLGGTNEDSNITLACATCNHERGKIAWRQKQTILKYIIERCQRTL